MTFAQKELVAKGYGILETFYCIRSLGYDIRDTFCRIRSLGYDIRETFCRIRGLGCRKNVRYSIQLPLHQP